MKHFFLLFLSIHFFSLLQAQGNLQFNAVKIITLDDGTQTVPSGKVWKINFASRDAIVTYIKRVSGTGSGTTGCATSGTIFNNYVTTTETVSGQGSILINNTKVVTETITTPVWLTSGNTLSAYVSRTPVQTFTQTNYKYTLDGVLNCGAQYNPPQVEFSGIISITEFNVVP